MWLRANRDQQMNKGLNNWLSAIAMLSVLFAGAVSAQSYTLAESQGKQFSVNAKSAVTIDIANANLADLVIGFDATTSSTPGRLVYTLFSEPDGSQVFSNDFTGSGSFSQSGKNTANRLRLQITSDDSYALNGIRISGVNINDVTVIGDVIVSNNVTVNGNVTPAVPEPETYALMGVGLLGLLLARRRKGVTAVQAIA